MKRIMILAAALLCTQAFAQLTPEQYKEKYDRQVRNVGYSGVGVETILDNWEAVAPQDGDMLLGRFNYFLYKGRSTSVVAKDRNKFLGARPTLTLKDTEGRDVNYFEEVFYDDQWFGMSQQTIDRLIGMYPYELLYRFSKINSLIDYEKESPDMALLEIRKFISDYSADKGGAWTLRGEPVGEDDFLNFVQDYCASLYAIGSADSFGAFYEISTIMNKAYPRKTTFLDNMGSYWLVCMKNGKKAMAYYNKALKINPEDEVAQKNKAIAAKQMENDKKKK